MLKTYLSQHIMCVQNCVTEEYSWCAMCICDSLMGCCFLCPNISYPNRPQEVHLPLRCAVLCTVQCADGSTLQSGLAGERRGGRQAGWPYGRVSRDSDLPASELLRDRPPRYVAVGTGRGVPWGTAGRVAVRPRQSWFRSAGEWAAPGPATTVVEDWTGLMKQTIIAVATRAWWRSK